MIKITGSEQIQDEYQRAYYLNLFKELCKKMNAQPSYRLSLLMLYRQSCNVMKTTKAIWAKEFGVTVSDLDAEQLHSWIWAYFKKKSYRQPIPLSTKQELYSLQKGRCKICGKELGNNWKFIHTDHYIPWTLVGDELENNLQLLCSVCNGKKNKKTNYVFENMIGLN